MSLANSIRTSTKWLFAGNAGTNVLNFLFGIALARLLVPEDFGLLVTAQIFTGVAGLVAGGGMGQALIRSKEATERDFNVVFTMQLAICTFIYAFFYAIAPHFAHWYDEPIYADLLRVTALNFLLRPLVANRNAWLHREMRFKARTLVGIATGIVVSLTSILMAWLGFGVWSLAFAGILASLLKWILLSRLTPLRPKLEFDRATARRIGGTGIKFSLLDIVSYLRGQISNFVIGRLAGPAAVGLFNKAESLAKLPYSTLSAAVYDPLFRVMSKERDDIDKSKYLYFRAVTLLLAYTLPSYIAFSWLAEPFIAFVYGPNWSGAAAPLSILAWVWVFSCIGHPAGALLAAQNRLGQELVVQTISLGLYAIACVVGMRWGLEGVAWGLLIARLYTLTHMMWLVNLCFRVRAKDLANAIKPGLTLGGATLFMLFLVSANLPAPFQAEHRGLFLALSVLAGGTGYALVFLFAPLPALADEANRWRGALGMRTRGK